MAIPHTIVDAANNTACLLVPPEHAERARRELALYSRENRRVATAVRPVEMHGLGVAGVAGYTSILVATFYLQVRSIYGVDWIAAGGLDGIAVRSGEWWRAVTALTLHADASHLVANLLFGIFFGAFAGQYLGSGFAWFTIVAAAAIGNLLDLALLPASHRAIGASTAVFAALGVVAGFVWLSHARAGFSWARRYAPLIGGVVLLAYIGTGDAQTDAVAHLTGAIAGFAAGTALGRRPWRVAADGRFQAACGLLTIAVVAACWWRALSPML